MLCATASLHSMAPNIMTLFVKHWYSEQDFDSQKLIKKLKQPGKYPRMMFKHMIKKMAQPGLYASYAGFMTYSDADGQIVFPRKHTKNEIIYVITPKIRPVIIHGTAVEFFIIDENKPAEMYRLTRQKTDDNQYYWHTEEIKIPQNRRVPSSAIVIHAKPKNIKIPTKPYATIDGQNLLLPPIFTKNEGVNVQQTLAILKVNKFFQPVDKRFKYTAKTYATAIMP
jgi:hypothetical protein